MRRSIVHCVLAKDLNGPRPQNAVIRRCQGSCGRRKLVVSWTMFRIALQEDVRMMCGECADAAARECESAEYRVHPDQERDLDAPTLQAIRDYVNAGNAVESMARTLRGADFWKAQGN